jgi:hypothetical protein
MTNARMNETINDDARPGAEILELILAHSYARPVVTEIRCASTVAFPARSGAFSPAPADPPRLLAR